MKNRIIDQGTTFLITTGEFGRDHLDCSKRVEHWNDYLDGDPTNG